MNPRAYKRTSLKVISIAAGVLALALAPPPLRTPADIAARATARARGTDMPTAVTVGKAVLARPLPAQITRIRCENVRGHRVCGIVLSGVKFATPVGRRGFDAEVAFVIRTAFAAAPLEEVDLWTTVPLGVGKGVAVSGDMAVASAATVFAITVPRPALARLDAQLASGNNVFWDAAFADSLKHVTF